MNETGKDSVTALVEEIRAAVARTTPSRAAAAAAQDGPSAGDAREEVRSPLSRAEKFVTPSVPEGARLALGKKLALRVLRFLWRDQAAFNALSLEAQIGLLHAVEQNGRVVADLRRDVAALRADLEAWKRDQEREREAAGERLERRLGEQDASARRRASIQDGRIAALEVSGPAARAALPAGVPAAAAAEIPPGVYSLFEERFRGDPDSVAEKQSAYLPLLKDLPGPVLDVGCGRGEFLAMLRAADVPASGVESNPLWAALGREAGLAIEEGDGIAALEGRAKGSLGGVVAFQVVEHWPAAATWAFLRAARRALAPGGVLIAETINTDSLSALKTFFLDPTHVRPVPAEALRFLAEAAGFADTRIEYGAPLPPGERLIESSPNDARLNRLLFGPQDYALIARAV
ncbi:MAG: class I SAM-dependent methyltransferase [Thermoanaerobaculia bacterium]